DPPAVPGRRRRGAGPRLRRAGRVALPVRPGADGGGDRDFVEKRVAGWDAQGFDLWVAEERATGRVIGFVGLSVPRFLPEVLPAVEVGWRLHPDVWGRGYATEGVTVALDEAFTTL